MPSRIRESGTNYYATRALERKAQLADGQLRMWQDKAKEAERQTQLYIKEIQHETAKRVLAESAYEEIRASLESGDLIPGMMSEERHNTILKGLWDRWEVERGQLQTQVAALADLLPNDPTARMIVEEAPPVLAEKIAKTNAAAGWYTRDAETGTTYELGTYDFDKPDQWETYDGRRSTNRRDVAQTADRWGIDYRTHRINPYDGKEYIT
jgi:hypothetical protein